MSAPVKIVIDAENAGKPNEELARRIFDEAMRLQADGRETDALNLLRTAQETLQLSQTAVELVVPLTDEEIAQRDTDEQAAQEARQAEKQRARQGLRARRDRYLAQTDVFALPDAALPTDLPANLRDAIVANRDAWRTYRQQLRDYMQTVDDPFDPPPFPEQPAQPPLVLT